MYQYIYDTFLLEKRHARVLADLENRLTDLGIQGRIDRLHPLKSLRESVEDGLKKGVRTVVAVGNDETLKKLLDIVPGKNVVLGYVPMVTPSPFANLLGIPTGVAACDILSARLTETLDIGRVNGQYFLSAVSFAADNVTLECEGRFKIELAGGGHVSVCNIASLATETQHLGNPFDGYLEAVFRPQGPSGLFRRTKSALSVLRLRKIVAYATKPFSLFADGRELKQQTVEIDLAKEHLRMIIGKGRMFAEA